ncbi:MAG: hypothetical protein H6772_03290 [Pseudomonadales bacterium]|nr:hypothetical protein [Pseudomonadales bacterium]
MAELKATVFYCSGKNDFFLTLISIFSLATHVKNIEYYIYHEKYNIFHEQIVDYLNKKIHIHLIDKKTINATIYGMTKYKNIKSFMEYGWSGKKCFLPLIFKKTKKSILIDSDTIFFSKPVEIIEWINKENKHNLYLKDYKNFSIISKSEAKTILGEKLSFDMLNSGLLCFNIDAIFSKLSLIEINVFIEKILKIVQTRLTFDAIERSKFFYVFPLLEQSLHLLIFNKSISKSLPKKKYFVLPKHTIFGENIKKAIFIHYTGDSLRLHIYKQLFLSLFSYLIKQNSTLWFINKNRCLSCSHPKIPFWYKLL